MATQKIPGNVQNGVKIIIFLTFCDVSDFFYRKNVLYVRIIADRASMMAMGELQWVRGMLFTTIQTCYANFDGSEGPKVGARKIPCEVQNGAKIIIFALFEVLFWHFNTRKSFLRDYKQRSSIDNVTGRTSMSSGDAFHNDTEMLCPFRVAWISQNSHTGNSKGRPK